MSKTLLITLLTLCCSHSLFAQEPAPATTDAEKILALQAEVDRLKSIVPGQATAMTQVAYNFSNLWFAAAAENWTLSSFYWRETRVRLRWAIRISPVSKTANGEVDLQPILANLEEPFLANLNMAIENKDLAAFATAYDQTMTTCYGCHVVTGRPYLTLARPNQPAEAMINFSGHL